MSCRSWGRAWVVLVGLAFLVGPACRNRGPAAPATLNVLLENEADELKINDKIKKGKGKERTVETFPLEIGKRHSITVSAIIKPNTYTTITRSRQITLQAHDTIDVDLTKKDDKEPDDIEVIFVPTPKDVVGAMCRLAKVGKDDVVYDLGCGDGIMVITAVKEFGAQRGVGIDLNPERVSDSRANAKKAGVEDRVEFRQGDVLKVKDLSDASVVLLYMGDFINQRLQPILQSALKPGARVVSHRFLMRDDWKPDRTEKMKSKDKPDYECEIHLWVIRAEPKQ